MRRLTRWTLIALTPITIAATSPAQDQTPGAPKSPRETAQAGLPAPAQPPMAPPIRFDLEFPGGRLADYIAAIRAQNPAANIVLMGSFEHATAPQVTLKAVSTSAAIQLLTNSRQEGPQGSAWIETRTVENPGGSEPVMVVDVSFDAERPSSRREVTTVISLAQILQTTPMGKMRVEDVLSAIEAAMAVRDGAAPIIRFHAETSLLLFRGDAGQVELLRDTLAAVEQSANTPRPE